MLGSEFFQQNTADVARQLVGCFLVVTENGQTSRYQITETEGYLGPEDTASHARFGGASRSRIMYGSPGSLYVYLVYGMHHMLNIVTQPESQPGAVLIRGIEGYDGPGKLTAHLGITKQAYNEKPLGKQSGIWIESRPAEFDTSDIKATQRIGIDYATKEWVEKPLRFVLLDARSADKT